MINPFVTSFYKITNDPDLTTSIDSIGTPISMFCVGITMRLGSKLSTMFGPFISLTFFVLMAAICIMISSMVPTFYLFVLFHNVGYNLWLGMLFLPPIQNCIKYLKKYPIIVNTFALAGTGLGSTFFGIDNTKCMNPENYYP